MGQAASPINLKTDLTRHTGSLLPDAHKHEKVLRRGISQGCLAVSAANRQTEGYV